MKKYNTLTKTILIFFTAYIVFGAFLYLSQQNLIYHPTPTNPQDCTQLSQQTHKNTTFYYHSQNTDTATILYHGNAGNACQRAIYKDIVSPDTSLVIVEYTAYREQNKIPSKQNMLQDAKNIADWQNITNYTNINIIGESLGTSIASYHSNHAQVNTLILLNPFYSLQRLARTHYPLYPSFLLTETYNTRQYLEGFTGNITILHAEQDQIVPPLQSQKLKDSLTNATVQRQKFPRETHNSLLTNLDVQAIIRNLTAT